MLFRPLLITTELFWALRKCLNGGLSSVKDTWKHLQDSQTVRNKILWSDENINELVGLKSKAVFRQEPKR